ncbi:MAG: AAA family ATPase, partial [Clostridium sp.]
MRKEEYQILSCFKKNLEQDVKIFFKPFLNGEMLDIVLVKEKCGVILVSLSDLRVSGAKEYDKRGILLEKKIKLNPIVKVKECKDSLFSFHMESLLKAKVYKSSVYGVVKCFIYFMEEEEACKENFIFDNHVYVFCKREVEKLVEKVKEVFSKENNLFTKEIYDEFIVKLKGEKIEKITFPRVFLSKGQSASAISREGDSKIKGVAGAGKTVVLAHRVINGIERVKALGKRNPKVIILTYNITLRTYILGIIQNLYEGREFTIEIKHYHKFIIDKGRELDIVISKESFNDINVFEDGVDKIEKYDCILIDEIQDYEINWQRIIKKYFLKENGEYVLFGDEKQNIYERELDSLRKVKTNVRGNWRTLNKSFRVGGKLAEVALKFQREFLKKKYELDSEEELIYDSLFGMDQFIDYKKIGNLEEGIDYVYKLTDVFNKIKNEN